MANISKTAAAVLVIITVVLCGCGKSKEKKLNEQVVTVADRDKTRLLNKIEKKYENPEAHYRLGKLYHADGLWDKAEFEYNVAMGFDPVHRRAQAAIVRTLQDGGSDARAKLLAEIYMNQASSSAEASLLLGQAFQKELLDDYALACYQQAQAIAPSSAALYKQIGYYYLSKKDTVRAEENLRRSFQINPYQAEVAGELGRMGIMVQIPRKIQKNTKKLDKMINEPKEDK